MKASKYEVDPLITELAQQLKIVGLSRVDLGTMIGTDRVRIGEYARGVYRPRIDYVRAWLDAMSCDVVVVPIKYKTLVQEYVDELTQND